MDAANLTKENVELERALAPRMIDSSEFTRAVSQLPRLPILIQSIDSEEPKQLASAIAFWLRAVQYGDTPTWNVTTLPAVEHGVFDGIEIKYKTPFWDHSVTTDAAEKVAVEFCEALKSQGLAVSASPAMNALQWVASAPAEAVVVRVGAKPSHFWENKRLRERGLPETAEPNWCTSAEFFEQTKRR
jgi:hypothetical protein